MSHSRNHDPPIREKTPNPLDPEMKISDKIKQENRPVAVIYGASYTSLYILRGLTNKVPVILIAPDDGFAAHSRFVDQRIIINNFDEKKLVDTFIAVGQQLQQKGVLFPSGDYIVKVLCENFVELGAYYHAPVEPKHTLKLINKEYQQKLCEKIGVGYPKSFHLHSDSYDLSEIKEHALFPLVIKPSDPILGKKLFKILQVNDIFEIEEVLERFYIFNSDYMVSEYIPGEPVNIWGYNGYCGSDSSTIAGWAYNKPSQRPYYHGVSSVIKYEANSVIENLSRRLISHASHCGPYETEFKYDQRDGTYKLIEINPRYGKTQGVGIPGGVNLPLIHYYHAIHDHRQLGSMDLHQSGKKCHLVCFQSELLNLFDQAPKGKFIRNLLRIPFLENKSWGIYSPGDFWPAVVNIKRAILSVPKKVFRRAIKLWNSSVRTG